MNTIYTIKLTKEEHEVVQSCIALAIRQGGFTEGFSVVDLNSLLDKISHATIVMK